ncbi:GIY-YIG domain-containing protein [Clostridium butyricum]|uniref:GIY-YIG domain-containing protein n=2 Tax=Clostridium butyricum TaxID=1492 RepID=A0A512TKM4_CLOBU|nr:GIY-YIG domain-containing protein [Clostridium butyricum]
MMNYVYILECSDGTLYTGWTNNLDKRIEQHCNGTGAKYTRGRGPVRLVYHEEFNDKRDAMRREYEIKRYSRINKLKLIEKMQKYDKK